MHPKWLISAIKNKSLMWKFSSTGQLFSKYVCLSLFLFFAPSDIHKNDIKLKKLAMNLRYFFKTINNYFRNRFDYIWKNW